MTETYIDLPEEQLNLEYVRRELRYAYLEQKRKTKGEDWYPSPKQDKVETWEKIAKNCISCKAKPVYFIRAQFTESDQWEFGPPINSMCGPHAVKLYQKFKTKYLNKRQYDKSPELIELLETIESVMILLNNRAGGNFFKLDKESQVKELLNPLLNIPPSIRLYLNRGISEKVVETFSGDALRDELSSNPCLIPAYEELKINIIDYL